LDSSIDNDIVCLNSSDGNLLWRSTSGHHSAIAVTSDAIFVVYNNFAGIRKYGPSGKFVWEKHLNGTGSDYLYIVDDQIQVLTVPENFWILDFDGNEIEILPGENIFIKTPEETFIESNGIQLINNDSKEVVWQYHQFDDVLEMVPVFVPGLVFVRTGQASGSIYTFNRSTGELLWQTTDNIISNIAYSPLKKTIYALTQDGRLLSIKEGDGNEEIIAKFTATQFVLNGEEDVGNYQLAYDLDKNVLFVSLGDSRQLFAFEEK
jgi:outer membrane protein assembly factor BamB